jgi:tetratricopeptide (TPR) repeat protein
MRLASLVLVWLVAMGAVQATSIDEGRAALSQGQLSPAVTLLEKTVAEQPENAEAHYQLGVAYGRLAEKANMFRRYSLAAKTRHEFERAVELAPDDLDARLALVEFYTMAPGFLGGDEGKAFRQAAEIESRDQALGRRAVAFVQSHGKIPIESEEHARARDAVSSHGH